MIYVWMNSYISIFYFNSLRFISKKAIPESITITTFYNSLFFKFRNTTQNMNEKNILFSLNPCHKQILEDLTYNIDMGKLPTFVGEVIV